MPPPLPNFLRRTGRSNLISFISRGAAFYNPMHADSIARCPMTSSIDRHIEGGRMHHRQSGGGSCSAYILSLNRLATTDRSVLAVTVRNAYPCAHWISLVLLAWSSVGSAYHVHWLTMYRATVVHLLYCYYDCLQDLRGYSMSMATLGWLQPTQGAPALDRKPLKESLSTAAVVVAMAVAAAAAAAVAV